MKPGTVAGRRAVAEALRAGEVEELLVVESARQTEGFRSVIAAADEAGVRVKVADRLRLDRMADDHQGVVAVLRGRPRANLTERELATWRFGEDDVVVVLDGITDPQNLGAAARSAEAAGAAMLVTRARRAAGVTPAAVRASAGALLHLPHALVANIARAIERLQQNGFFVVGLDQQAPRGVYDEPAPEGRIALVVGSEGEGLSRLVRQRCDALVSLPVRGRVDSLNASAALAAVLYAWILPSRRR